MTLPGLPGGDWRSAYTIADNGTLAGAAFGPDYGHAVVWRGC